MTKVPPAHEIPEPRATATVPIGGGESIIVRRHGNPAGTRILLSHGNGLAADLYYPFWKLFLEDFDLLVYDMRNHGRNEVGDLRNHNPMVFATDLDEHILPVVDRAFGKKPTVGIFHSLSALVSLLLPSRGAAFAGLFLFDAPICAPGHTQQAFDKRVDQLTHALRIREEHYPSLEIFETLAKLSPMTNSLDSQTIRLLATTVLRPSPDDSQYVFRCPPEFEAQALEFMTAYAAFIDFESMRCPVRVLGADPTSTVCYLPSFDLGVIHRVDYDYVPETGHFLQLEQPETCHAATMEFIGQLALAPDRR